ncbi:unnamed protein product [Lymnaea stagnalis]|uniref:Uncharacterized protein n=1 Tax=Lymnaea stagnalis TaxID=6523 RepID=A0AAV2I3U0_LYMST
MVCFTSIAMAKPKDEMIQAINENDIKKLSWLLKKKMCVPDIIINSHGQTPLILAVTLGKIECVKVLLKWNAKVDAADKHGMTAIMYAADLGYLDCLQLMEDKADFNKADNEGITALMLSSRWGKDDCVQFLINNQCNVNQRDRACKTALIHAAGQGKRHSVQCLLNSKADVDALSSEGYTAVMYALQKMEIETAKLLIKSGAKVDQMGTDGKTALSYAFQNCLGDFEIVKCILKNGADMTVSKTDQSYLHEMIARGEKEIVRLMLINGCPPFDRRCFEYCFSFIDSNHHETPISPLCVALLSGQDDLARYFIVNNFFTSYDMFILPNETELKQKLDVRVSQASDTTCVHDYLPWHKPHSLYRISFVFVCGVLNSRTCSTCRNKDKELMKLKLPEKIINQLLFQKSLIHLCTNFWHDVSLEADQDLENCLCFDCDKERRRGIRGRQMGGLKIKFL